MREYDCIVVGARCAGSALAVYLARAGKKVLLLEADKLHSDQPFSTHAIQAPGMDVLDDLGVGARIRAVTPAVRTSRVSVRGHALDIPVPIGRELYCPRRSTLDPLLQDAAVTAGAELRAETRVSELLYDGERVCGVRAEHAGASEHYRARWVIGADGRNSTVARLVSARDYVSHETERAGYWGYWQKPACWDRDDPWRRFQTAIDIDETARFAFECDGDLLVAGAFAPYTEVRSWGRRYPEELVRSLRASPLTAALVETDPVSPLVGLLKARFYMREATGPGWALVGDAGVHKDPTPGFGITDALRDAAALAEALIDGRPEALQVFWRKRDVAAIPLYYQALSMGSLAFANPFNEWMLDHVQVSPTLLHRMQQILDRTRSPQQLVPHVRLIAWMLQWLVRGRTEMWSPFLAAARDSVGQRRELKASREALQLAAAALDRANGAGVDSSGDTLLRWRQELRQAADSRLKDYGRALRGTVA